jgi:hypothetical protein
VVRKAAIPAVWQMLPAITVFIPPIRSATQPQNCRARKAAASSTESISAPSRAPIPRSPQKATRCAAGIAIGMQQRKEARPSSASAKLGGRPSTASPATGPLIAAAPATGTGAGRSTSAASGRIVTAAKTP